jgi:MinD superfamily P-loop ATPase
MKELVILSGKGGTGKTSLAAAFASLAAPVVVADADVDAPDLHILLGPELRARREFRAGFEARIRAGDCTACGLCLKLCRFDAISADYVVDAAACEGCGVCVEVCPAEAVDFVEKVAGEWYLARTRVGPMAHALLKPGEENSGKLVAVVRKAAQALAAEEDLPLVLVDGPPGVGCPVISSVTGAAAALIVAEPTLTGIQGFARAAELAAHFGVPAALVVNKADVHEENAAALAREAGRRGIPVLGFVPYDPAFTAAQRARRTAVEAGGPVAETLAEIWTVVEEFLEGGA